MSLRLDFCSHQAARHAVMRWHYSRAMLASKLVRIGVWEHQKFRDEVLERQIDRLQWPTRVETHELWIV